MPRIMEAEGLQATRIFEGTQVYCPDTTVVPMSDPRSPFYERAMGFYDENLRQGFIDSSVRMAGLGGGGLTLAVMLAKEGVRDFSIADIDEIDETNVGRIPLLTPDDVGRSKTEVAAELIVRHNPTARVRLYEDGVQEGNVDEFLGMDPGNAGITVGFDEIELTEPRIGLLLHRAARRNGIYIVAATDVERGGLVTTFDPSDLENTFEHYNGAKPSDSEEDYLRKVRGFQLPTIPNIPLNGDIKTLISTLNKAPLPTTLRSVLNATDLAMDEFERLLTLDDPRYDDPHFYPRIHCVNPSRNEDFVSSHPRLRSTSRILKLIARSMAGKNPPASYGKRARASRSRYREQFANSRK